ncbi:hypothetical protein [Archangium sp.]|uniref:tetratricopeptide repeat protein n=1 Tax=Archangium sp. TaxID=1872627 RepID=UPI002ED7C698
MAAPSSWADLFQLEVTGESGTVSTWPVTLLERPPSSLTLDMEHAGELLWTLSPAEASKLASGQYRIAAVLTSGDATPEGAWKGTVRSPAVLLTLLDEPTPLSLEFKEQKMMVFSDFHLVRGEVDEAARVIAAHLAEDPESIDGLAMSGELAVLRGNIPEAVRLYEQAIAVHSKRFPDSPEPPVTLYSRLYQLQKQLPARSLPYPFEYKK